MEEALYTVAGYLATPQRPYPLNGGVLNCPHPGQAGWLAEVVLRVDRKFKVLRVTGSRDVGDRGRRGKIGVTGPGRRIAHISGTAASGEAGNYQGCTIV